MAIDNNGATVRNGRPNKDRFHAKAAAAVHELENAGIMMDPRQYARYVAIYLDHKNNYLTIDKIAGDYGITPAEARICIDAGRLIHDVTVTAARNLDGMPSWTATEWPDGTR